MASSTGRSRPNVSTLAPDGRRKARPELQRLSVRDSLHDEIERLGPGGRLPPEPELAKDLKVSRATLREALRYFEEEGMVTRVPGAGTFVTRQPAIRNNLAVNAGVTELIASHGMKPGSLDMELREEPTTAEMARHLGLEAETPVWVVDRTRTADGAPVIFSRDVVPVDLLDDGAEQLPKLGDGSLYDLLAERGYPINHGIASIRPVAADREVASRLGVKRGTMLLCLVQVDYDRDGTPTVLSYEHHLPDVFDVTVLRRNAAR